MTLETLIQNYGYLAILIGTFLEGEVILILGGLAAHLGYLELPWVIASAFAGTFGGDQLYFFIGRRYGQRFLDKRPRWKKRSERIWALLHRHQDWVVLGFRFVYGTRTLTPFVIGMSWIKTLRYVVLNFLGAVVWAIAFGVLGYVFGQVVAQLVGQVKRYEVILFGTVAVLGLVLWGVRLWRQRRQP
jgi:membrane protein DedA with SNARE-associated domain